MFARECSSGGQIASIFLKNALSLNRRFIGVHLSTVALAKEGSISEDQNAVPGRSPQQAGLLSEARRNDGNFEP